MMNICPIENGYAINGTRIEKAPDFVQYTKNISLRVGDVYIRRKEGDAKRTIKAMYYINGILSIKYIEEGLGQLNFTVNGNCLPETLRAWGRT